MRLGVIGGTGLYDWPRARAVRIESPWTHVDALVSRTQGVEVLFVPRHGPGHSAAPHQVDYRGHAWAMRSAHCDAVVGINNVGALDTDLTPGNLVVPSDVIDRTTRRPTTLYEQEAVHVPMDPPYCPTLSRALRQSAHAADGVLAVAEGPRFETPAEARALRLAGATVVGMTGMPEAALMREAGLHYASLCFVANPTGRDAGSATAIRDQLAVDAARLRAIVRKAARSLPARQRCRCHRALEGARLATG